MNYTQGKRFLDTNVLFYSCDTSDAIRHQKALNLIAECSRHNSGVLSVQVLGEFFHATVVHKKLLTAEEAERAVVAFRSAMKCASI